MNLKDYIGEATAYDKKLMLERKDPTSWLKSVNYGRKINDVESSSEHFDVEVDTEVDTDKTGMNTGGTVNPPVNPPVNLPVNPPEKDVQTTLTKSARAVLAALKSDSSLTYDALAAKLKLHRDTIRVSIASLVRMNLLRRVGSDKTGHWEVVK